MRLPVRPRQRHAFSYLLLGVWYCGAVQNTQGLKMLKRLAKHEIWNLICQMLLHCKVLEKPTLLKSWVVQVSPHFISSTNKILIKIACTFKILKSFFVAEICVTCIPKGVTSNPSLWSQELLGQYWESGIRMNQQYIAVVFVWVRFFFRKKHN